MGVTSPPALEFRDVAKVYHGQGNAPIRAIQEICFATQGGEFLALVGPSGCGKSTILRLAAGLETPSSGKVLFEGAEVTGPDRSRGIVFQSYGVFPWLTVKKNIAFGLEDPDAEVNRTRIKEWLDFAGLTDFATVFPKNLSGGMQQRLALARTMIVEPRLLLLDEPFGALDADTRANMRKLLSRAVRKTGCSVVMVTHSIREALVLSDRVVVLSRSPGKVEKTLPVPGTRPRKRAALRSTEMIDLYKKIRKVNKENS